METLAAVTLQHPAITVSWVLILAAVICEVIAFFQSKLRPTSSTLNWMALGVGLFFASFLV